MSDYYHEQPRVRRRKHKLQYGVRTLLVAMSLVAVLCALFVWQSSVLSAYERCASCGFPFRVQSANTARPQSRVTFGMVQTAMALVPRSLK